LYTGIMEFDISGLEGLFTRGQIEAQLHLTVKDGDLTINECLSLYNVRDENEDGVIRENDSGVSDFVGEACADLLPGGTIIIDVTSTLEHDLFDSNQTSFSGFVIDANWEDFIEFYDHTDPVNGPRLSVSDTGIDGDGIPDAQDNCPLAYNPGQEDTFPPGGNSIGDACDCEGNFNCSVDQDVDGSDASLFKSDFGRSNLSRPCITADPCNGDFSCNGNVDGTDASLFKSDFGRSSMQNPCPTCVNSGPWCSYPLP
jgi:hypothetical protein